LETAIGDGTHATTVHGLSCFDTPFRARLLRVTLSDTQCERATKRGGLESSIPRCWAKPERLCGGVRCRTDRACALWFW
jgi:hypothetical protein